MSQWICGWDIGGAHLKVALRDPAGRWTQVQQLPCPLWRGIEHLAMALQEAVHGWPVAPHHVAHAATMTGELVDAFANRAAGVVAIVDCCEAAFAGAVWRWFGIDGRMHGRDITRSDPLRFASANWLASADFAAQRASGLFIDIGSTTTDIVRLDQGVAQPRGFTDGERLSAGELVYRGVVRTPLMAVADAIDWRGAVRPLMAEHFATSADIFRLTGDLDESADVWPAADGGEKTPAASARRIARLIGEDVEAAPLDEWCRVAEQLAGAMSETILAAATQVFGVSLVRPSLVQQRGQPAEPPPGARGAALAWASVAPQRVVCAGVGHWFAARIAGRLGLPAVDFGALVGAADVLGAREHAPALAVAELAAAASAEHHSAG